MVKIKKWLAVTGMAALFSGALMLGGPAVKALAAGGPPAGVGAQAAQAANWGGAGMGLGRVYGGMISAVAQFLGISEPELLAARLSGKSVAQVATEKGVSEQQLVDYITGQRGAQIDQLVKDGAITQVQADLHKQFMAERVQENLNRATTGPNGVSAAGRQAGVQALKASSGAGTGMAAGRGAGFRRGAGRGAGYRAQAGLCPYYPVQAK